MLNFMRKHAQSWLIKVAFVVIIVVFVFWGVGSFRARRALVLAYVNGEPIYYHEFTTMFRQVIDSYRARFKNFNEDWIKKLNLKQTVLEQLIERKLLLQKAKKMGLTVSDTELWQLITQNPAFQKDGQFDPKRYETILARYHYTPAQFETSLKEDLILSKLRQIVQNLAHVSEAEAYEAYRWSHQKINLQFLSFNPEDFTKGLHPKEDILKQYFTEHKGDYLIPRQLKLVYVKISFAELMDEVEPSQAEIEQFYKNNLEMFHEPQKVCVRHILFRVPANASKEKKEKMRKRAEMVLKQAKQGKDFAKLAQKYSEDKATASKGGDLGCFPKGLMVKPFEKAAFSLPKGGISDLVTTRFGFHILKVYDIKKERTKSLAEVKEKITQRLKREKAKEKALELANRIYAQAILENSLHKAASKYNRSIQETSYFSEKEWAVEIPVQLKQQILSLKKGEITAPLEWHQGYILVQVEDKKPERIPTFEEVKETVKADWIAIEAKNKAREKAENVLALLKKGQSMQEIASRYKLKIDETGLFPPGIIPKIGFALDVVKSVFSLSLNQPLLDKVVEINGKFYILKLKERRDVDKAEYERNKKNFKKDLLIQRRAALFQTWINEIRKQAKIKVKQEMLQ
ncbi:MAG: SurA N-terminal domain-containing protein [Candidatus Desulfofervidaceae bacterium]|nr:SurA N-terminal domain-containing protein [Candidatus Desulfofervidaceae bacterium]MDL1971089.1 SurA N-terminal domain-containing protein [Candidatus Desulfofervidaceae bacterium]